MTSCWVVIVLIGIWSSYTCYAGLPNTFHSLLGLVAGAWFLECFSCAGFWRGISVDFSRHVGSLASVSQTFSIWFCIFELFQTIPADRAPSCSLVHVWWLLGRSHVHWYPVTKLQHEAGSTKNWVIWGSKAQRRIFTRMTQCIFLDFKVFDLMCESDSVRGYSGLPFKVLESSAKSLTVRKCKWYVRWNYCAIVRFPSVVAP